jgi:hypothetical protein
VTIQEARWLKERLASIPDQELFPLLNVGSSTHAFRTVDQPHIDELVFASLRARNGRVIHLDVKAAPGVDVVGDLMDAAFRRQVAAMQVRSAIVSNLLEHVTDRAALAELVLNLLPPGGWIFVTGPRDYPYHEDPIDTMYRPTVEEAAGLFEGARVVEGEIIDAGHWQRGGRPAWRVVARLAVPVYRPRKWWELLRQSPYLVRPIKAFAVALKKDEGAAAPHELHT